MLIRKGRHKDNGYVIISSETKEYMIQSWKKTLTSYEFRDDSALNPVIFATAEEALEKVLSLSEDERETFFLVAQWFDDFDRH